MTNRRAVVAAELKESDARQHAAAVWLFGQPLAQPSLHLQHIWKILDDTFEQMEHERFAAAWRAWGIAQRHPGQPMSDWISTLKKLKLELKEQDTTTLSDEAVASKAPRF